MAGLSSGEPDILSDHDLSSRVLTEGPQIIVKISVDSDVATKLTKTNRLYI